MSLARRSLRFGTYSMIIYTFPKKPIHVPIKYSEIACYNLYCMDLTYFSYFPIKYDKNM